MIYVEDARCSGFKEARSRWVRGILKLQETVGLNELKKRVRKIRERDIKNLDENIKRAISAFEENHINVYFAKDSDAAIKIFESIVPPGKTVVKSKSNVVKEVGLINRLSNRNKFIETDCGDYLVSLFGVEGAHPVLPAVSLSISDISKKIKELFGVKLSTPDEIAHFVKEKIMQEIVKAEYGLTGANFITTEGNIVLIENEGNISLVSRIPRKHIIITSVDKIVGSLEDAITLAKAEILFSLGKKCTSYINIISSPSKTADIENKIVYGMYGAEEIHLILVDNNRTSYVGTPFEEALYCIGCGACLMNCPVFNLMLNNYGYTYKGGIGIIKEMIINGIDRLDERAYYCTTCGFCKSICPVGIDIPRMIRIIRSKIKDRAPKNVVEMENKTLQYGSPFGNLKKVSDSEELYCC